MPSSIAATLVGGPTLAFNYAGLKVLLDPTFDEPGEYPAGPITLLNLFGPAIASDDLARVDLVLLSHDQHPDNLDRTGRALLAGVSTVSMTDALGKYRPTPPPKVESSIPSSSSVCARSSTQ
jgi:L-ascorbate metabolism protein UlaG (beta-lactamase superfamily)